VSESGRLRHGGRGPKVRALTLPILFAHLAVIHGSVPSRLTLALLEIWTDNRQRVCGLETVNVDWSVSTSPWMISRCEGQKNLGQLLLGRNAQSFPPIASLDAVPAGVSAQAEGFIRVNDPHIYVITTNSIFQRLRRAPDRCGDFDAARKLASLLVHEEVHARHLGDERQAYAAQLITLTPRRGSGSSGVFGGRLVDAAGPGLMVEARPSAR
jgi:hypothetical protein